MRVINAQEQFNTARALHEEALKKEGNERKDSLDAVERLYNDILNHNVGTPVVLYTLAALHMERGYSALGIAILERVVSEHPQFGEAWNNLGICWKSVLEPSRADECFANAIRALQGNEDEDIYADSLCNRAAMHTNQGTPKKALAFCNQALEHRPNHTKAKWHKALALLELQRWDEAWEWHEARLLEGAADHNVANRNYHEDGATPWWDGRTPGLIAIHGEQGLGDEIMFSSCIPDLRGEGRRFVFEPSPRTHQLFKQSFKQYPDIEVHGTHETDGRDWIAKLGRPDFKIALGSLPKLCRRKVEDFPGTPFLIPPAVAATGYKKRLAKLGNKPKIGITWQGGVVSTEVHLRSLFPKQLAPLFEHDCDFISLQYTELAEENIADSGLPIIHWPDAVDSRTSTGKNIGQLAALIANLDMVITVCQTAVHIAGALGVPCLVLTPSKPSWRYGVTGDMPWYSSVHLIRQTGDDWEPVILEAKQRLEEFLKERNHGQSHAAA